MADYWEIDGFQDLYLEDSWVLRIDFAPGRLTIGADLVLREAHPEFCRPEPGEQYCYRRGEVRFQEMRELTWSGIPVRPAVDATGESDLGSFDGFQVHDGRYILTGEFGHLEIVAAPPQVYLEELSGPLSEDRPGSDAPM